MRWSRSWSIPVACFAAFAGGALVSEVARGDKRDDSPHAAIEQLAKVIVQIENRYVDPVDRAKLLQGAIKGMVAELDPHSEYFPPKEFVEFTGETEGKFGGVGIEFDATGEYLTVLNPIEGGPAEAAGRAAARTTGRRRHLARMVDDVLELGRLRNGKVALGGQRLDLAEAVRDCV